MRRASSAFVGKVGEDPFGGHEQRFGDHPRPSCLRRVTVPGREQIAPRESECPDDVLAVAAGETVQDNAPVDAFGHAQRGCPIRVRRAFRRAFVDRSARLAVVTLKRVVDDLAGIVADACRPSMCAFKSSRRSRRRAPSRRGTSAHW